MQELTLLTDQYSPIAAIWLSFVLIILAIPKDKAPAGVYVLLAPATSEALAVLIFLTKNRFRHSPYHHLISSRCGNGTDMFAVCCAKTPEPLQRAAKICFQNNRIGMSIACRHFYRTCKHITIGNFHHIIQNIIIIKSGGVEECLIQTTFPFASVFKANILEESCRAIEPAPSGSTLEAVPAITKPPSEAGITFAHSYVKLYQAHTRSSILLCLPHWFSSPTPCFLFCRYK